MKKSATSFFTLKLRSLLALIVVVVLTASQFVTTSANICAPVTTGAITVNGVVVSVNPGVAQPCSSDVGWQGIVGQTVTPVTTPGGTAGGESANVFVVGKNVSAGKVGDLFIGVHTQNDPELDVPDKVMTYFDANGNGVFETGDFALGFEPAATPPTNAENCNQNVNIFGFRFDPAASPNFWQPITTLGGVTAKLAFDYSTAADPEDKIWELEIGINVSAFNTATGLNFQPAAQGTSFRMGTKLIMVENGAAGAIIWLQPAILTSDHDDDFFPNGDTVLNSTNASTLEPISFDSCADVIVESLSSLSPGGVPSGFKTLTNADFDGSGNTLSGRQTSFTGTVRFQTNPPGGPAPVIGNPGTATFKIMPWGSNGKITSVDMRTESITFTQINASDTKTFTWPPTHSAYSPVETAINTLGSNHACYGIQLAGFPVNTPNADFAQINLSYVQTSTVKETFQIAAEPCNPQIKRSGYTGRPDCEETQEYILRAGWSNIAADEQCIHNPSASQAWKCENRAKWTYLFPTAKKLKLKHLGNGYYSIILKKGETRNVPITLIGGLMPVDPVVLDVSAKAGGQLLSPPTGENTRDVPVKEGQILTIIGTGEIFLESGERRVPIGPDGISLKPVIGIAAVSTAPRFLLNSRFYNPEDRIGALIGSFDGFKTSFVIGSNSTFMVPEGATVLSLGVNDLSGAFGDNIGQFGVNIIPSAPVRLPTRLVLPPVPETGVPLVMKAGATLPQLQLDLFRRIPPAKKGRRGLLRPATFAIYAVYGSHARRK